ncbi:MAG TPA: hypothetical protein VJS30_13835 [Paraburkholderia sp.]|nr:hypothetical protein [Burkholderia metallica]HKT97594.1 hypothetical protein [Paraburkholderia sp.]
MADKKTDVVTMTTYPLQALLDGNDNTTMQRHPKPEYRRVS